MRLPVPQLIVILCLYLSFIRGTNIGLFYPADESSLASIDYRYQAAINYILLCGISLYFLLKNNYLLFINKFIKGVIPVFLGLALVSIALSVDRIESIKFAVAVGVISFPVLLYQHEFGSRALLNALGKFVVVMAVLNLAYVFIFPEYGIMTGIHDGRWRGLFEHKNGAGTFFAIGFFIMLQAIRGRSISELFVQIPIMLICLLFIAMSVSATAVVLFGVLGLIYPLMLFLYRISPGERFAFLLILTGLGALSYVTVGSELIGILFALVGKDPTLTGRTGIWSAVMDLVAQRPVFGFGPGMSERTDFITQIQGDVGWEVKSTHNSYLDLLIGFGYPATFLIICYILKLWCGPLTRVLRTNTQLKIYAISSSLVVAMLFFGFSGGSAILSRSIFWIILLIALTLLSKPFEENGADAKSSAS